MRGIDAETELGVADSILVDDDKRLVSKEFVASARSFFDRTIRSFLSVVLPNTRYFRLDSYMVKLAKPFQLIMT